MPKGVAGWLLAVVTAMATSTHDGVRGAAPGPRFPAAAGILFGLGLGGFFDGIVLPPAAGLRHCAL